MERLSVPDNQPSITHDDLELNVFHARYELPDAPSRTVEYIEGSAAQKSENKTLCPYMYGTYQYNQWMAGFTEAADPLY